jgi:hypothetical protein
VPADDKHIKLVRSLDSFLGEMTDAQAGPTKAGQAAADQKQHTITLIQPSKHDSTRFYQDYTSISDALEGMSSSASVSYHC